MILDAADAPPLKLADQDAVTERRDMVFGHAAISAPLPSLHGTRLSTSSATTAGSARVDVSPRPSVSLAAILRRMRRMILPLRVFGSAGAHWIASGEAIGPISLRTQAISSLRSASVGSSPSFSVT